ncbi:MULTISPECIES: DUF1697 domain-containing protein [unclassified Streptomyces]|uniref:DUF1697 domain-containing protein n=1 Tax=unclassified Streptomyces TaxID=2593676 RepID=UPI001BE9E572|nr:MULTISPECIES: DUF1697 domain-containing protein [unclassified Streptomyces]MBT2405056.1 DUF1697 domain-containing protein [Streptomyces sp. ISL-21]MBT2454656.1 DUF1697 domain-containing protein [Streptomyces sp. ISL-86]MBT2610782.1 DUF1697 domain-containing protein [Streptomyces sp. ISL-87]
MTTRTPQKFAALLRGINVGGSRKVPMAELREVLEGLGHADVQTYLQSGNVVFSSTKKDPVALARELEAAIEAHFGFKVSCLVLDGAYLRAVADACPFPAAELEGKQLHASFFSEQPPEDRFAAIDGPSYLPEEFRIGDRVVYLYAPNGLGRSKLAEALNRPAVVKGIDVTSRNWNTVAKLVELTADAP